MGKNKKRNVVQHAEVDEQQPSVPSHAPVDYSIPVHSKQAAFSLLYLFLYSVMMFTLPFGAFFGVKHVLAEQFNINGFPNTCYSVLSAVIVVNLIIVLYAYKAYHETEYDSDGNEIVEDIPERQQPQSKQKLNKKTK